MLFVVFIVIFVVVNMLSGDFVQVILGQGVMFEVVVVICQDFGFDKFLVMCYFEWFGGVVQGDFGNSFVQVNFVSFVGFDIGSGFGLVVVQVVLCFVNMMFLVGVIVMIVVLFFIIFGFLVVLYWNLLFDRGVNIFIFSLIFLLEFFLVYVLIFFFVVLNLILLLLFNIYVDMVFFDWLEKMLLLVLMLMLVVIVYMMWMMWVVIINFLVFFYIEMVCLKGMFLV